MHPSVHAFVAEVVKRRELSATPVLEIGSRDENGTVRDLFTGPYLGVDMRPGPGVDLVADVTDPSFAEVFGDSAHRRWGRLYLCLEMLEHCSRPWRALEAIGALMRPDEFLILTTRGFETGHMPVHAYPDDFYRYSLGAIAVLLVDAGLTVVDLEHDPELPGVLAVAVK